jgi:predicted  nucleic acid-binding Zn-ribbon protein
MNSTTSKREQLIAAMKKELDVMNADLQSIEAGAKELTGQAREAIDENLAALRKQASAANSKIDEMGAAAEDRWEGLTVEAARIKDAFAHSYNYLKSQLKR